MKTSLIDDIMDTAKLDSGNFKANIEEFELNDLVYELGEIFKL